MFTQTIPEPPPCAWGRAAVVCAEGVDEPVGTVEAAGLDDAAGLDEVTGAAEAAGLDEWAVSDVLAPAVDFAARPVDVGGLVWLAEAANHVSTPLCPLQAPAFFGAVEKVPSLHLPVAPAGVWVKAVTEVNSRVNAANRQMFVTKFFICSPEDELDLTKKKTGIAAISALSVSHDCTPGCD